MFSRPTFHTEYLEFRLKMLKLTCGHQIDPSSGATTVYRNLGPKPNGGWGWVPMNNAKPIATGIGSAGRNVLWGRLEKTNRYSYVGIDPNTRALR